MRELEIANTWLAIRKALNPATIGPYGIFLQKPFSTEMLAQKSKKL
jgi:hypothetical protein